MYTTKQELQSIYNKVVTTIYSCVTVSQLNSAISYANLFVAMTHDDAKTEVITKLKIVVAYQKKKIVYGVKKNH